MNLCWLDPLTHICGTGERWVKSDTMIQTINFMRWYNKCLIGYWGRSRIFLQDERVPVAQATGTSDVFWIRNGYYVISVWITVSIDAHDSISMLFISIRKTFIGCISYLINTTILHDSTIVRFMMTSSNGNIFRVTGHLCGEFTGARWIPHTKASDAEFWCFLWSAPE